MGWQKGRGSVSSDAYLTFFVVKIRLAASPVESLSMQIPSAEVFYDTCSCFPGQPCQTSHGGLANQDGKQGMGGQVGPFSCQCCPSSTSSPLLCPLHHSSTICAPILHFHSPILLPLRLSPSRMRTLNPASTSRRSICFLKQG